MRAPEVTMADPALRVADVIPPELHGLTFFTPAEHQRGIHAYRAWTRAMLVAYGYSLESMMDIIVRLEELQALPDGTRQLHTIISAPFLKSIRTFCAIKPSTYPTVPSLIEMLGDTTFLEAEGIAFLDGANARTRQNRMTDQAMMFAHAAEYFRNAAALARDVLKPEWEEDTIVAGSVPALHLGEGLIAFHTQAGSKYLRAQARALLHRITARAAHVLGPQDAFVHMNAPLVEVLALQERMPQRALHHADWRDIADAYELSRAVLRVRFINGDAAVAFLMNLAQLTVIVRHRDAARAYVHAAQGLLTNGLACTGAPKVAHMAQLLNAS